jgi:hypothetical protein
MIKKTNISNKDRDSSYWKNKISFLKSRPNFSVYKKNSGKKSVCEKNKRKKNPKRKNQWKKY